MTEPPGSPANESNAQKRRPGACGRCKARKSKCDGSRPACRRCQEAGASCVYVARRRHASLAHSVDGVPPLSPSPRATDEPARNEVAPILLHVGSIESQISNLVNPGLASPIASGVPISDPSEWLDQFTEEPLSSFDLSAADLSIASVQLMDFSLGFDHDRDDFLQQTVIPDNHWDVAQISIESPEDSFRKSEDQFMRDLYRSSTNNIEFGLVSVARSMMKYHKKHNRILRGMEKAIEEMMVAEPRIEEPESGSCYLQLWDPKKNIEMSKNYLRNALKSSYMEVQILGESLAWSLFDEVVSQENDDPAKIGLTYSLLAKGCNIYWLSSNRERAFVESSELFGVARSQQKEILGDSVLHFQALITMLDFAIEYRPSVVGSLITSSVASAQSLNLNSKNAVSRLCCNSDEELRLKGAFWLLFSIEKPYCLRQGHFSMVDDNTIDYLPLAIEDASFISSRFVYQCHFAKLCSHIYQELYSVKGSHLGVAVMESTIYRLSILSSQWQQAAIAGLSKDTVSSNKIVGRRLDEQAITLQYNEMMLLICCRAFVGDSVNSDSCLVQDLQKSMVKSACSILEIGNGIERLSSLENCHLIQIQCVAMCIVAMSMPVWPDRLELLKHLGFACGFFAKFSKSLSISYNKVYSVSVAAQDYMG